MRTRLYYLSYYLSVAVFERQNLCLPFGSPVPRFCPLLFLPSILIPSFAEEWGYEKSQLLNVSGRVCSTRGKENDDPFSKDITVYILSISILSFFISLSFYNHP